MRPAVIGCSFANLHGHFAGTCRHFQALSSNDVVTKELLEEESAAHEVMLLFTGMEFHGVRRYADIEARMPLPPEERLIRYVDVSGPQGKTCQAFMKYVPEAHQRHLMLVNFMEMTRHWMARYPGLLLVPVCNHRYEGFLKPEHVRSYGLLRGEHGDRCLDLSALDHGDASLWDEDTIHLSGKGRKRLCGMIREFVAGHGAEFPER